MESTERADQPAAPDDDAPHLLVVDDDTRIRNLLKQYLTENGFRITVAGNASEARRKLAGLDFDLLVLDVMMPGESGVDLTKALRAEKNVPILMLTALSETDSRIDGLEAGADDYLPKPFDPRELHSRVRALMRRAHGTPAPVLRLGTLEFDRSSRTVFLDGVVVPLRPRELAVLETLMTRPGRLVGKEQLSAEVFSFDDNVGINALEVYVGRLRRKLGDNGPAIRTVRGLGYMIEAA